MCEQLDRAFVILDWLHTYEHNSLEAWPISISDHAPLILDTHKRQTFHKRPQRFEAIWLLHPSCKKLIEETWQERISGSAAYILTTKLKRVQQVCNEWNKNDLGNIHKRLADLKNQLTYLQNQYYTPEIVKQEKEKQQELQLLLDMEESFWAQKARKDWIQKGDRNTKYFHALVKQRRINNRVVRIRQELGQWLEDDESIRTHVREHFKNLYQMPEEMSKEDILRKLDSYNLPGLSFIHRQELDKDFTEKEVKDAVFQLGAWTAPGSDGIPTLVPQKFWNIMGPTITQATLGFLKSGFILKELNNTFITLIPKCQSLEKVGDFRPISLCNVAYKVASKVLAKRLKPIMEDIIIPY